MENTGTIYSDVLVNSLLYITEVNTLVFEYLHVIDRTNPKFVDLEESIRSEILYHYVYCLGFKTSFKGAKLFALGMNKTPEDEKERILLNVRNILDYINASYTGEHFGLPLLMHINKLFLDGIKDIWDIGKMLSDRDEIDLSYDFEKVKTVIKQQDANAYINELEDYYLESQTAQILKNAIIFFELIHAGVFVSGNDAISLAVFAFLNRKANLHPYINYAKCISIINSKHNGEIDDPVEWLELYFNELAREMKDLKGRLIPFIEEVRAETTKYVDLNLRQIKGLQYIKEKGRISREIYSKLNGISQITSYRDLTNLLQKGYVRVEGIGKGTKYVLV